MSATNVFDKGKAEVADKVRKLLAQAEDPAATPEEAQTFTEKAQELMTKYAIELAMVADTTRPDEMVQKGWTVFGPYAAHKVTLINVVARTNDCRAIYTSLAGGTKRIEVLGHSADVDWVQTLSASLEIQLMSTLAAAIRQKPQHVHGRTYAVGFVHGFIAEISERLHKARRDAVTAAETEAHASPGSQARGVALVLVAKAARVEEEFKVRHPHARTVYGNTKLQSWSGYKPGRAAGSRASLARGHVGGGRQSLSA